MKILCIGHSSFDISVVVPEFPKENIKYRIDNRVECGGGPAANAAYLLGKWGIDTSFAGAVGYDSFGTKIKAEFKTVGVNTELLETNYELGTTMSFIVINEQNGSRTLFNCAVAYPQIKNLKLSFIPDVILIDGHEYETSKQILTKYPNSKKIIDAGRAKKEVQELSLLVDYLVCSQDFAEQTTNKKFDFNNNSSLASIYLDLKEKYKKQEIIITLGEKGALYQLNNSIKLLPAIKKEPNEVKDTTGAGDLFHGAFTYAIANGYDLEKAITISNITAGLSVRHIGARNSVPDLNEVLEYYEKHK